MTKFTEASEKTYMTNQEKRLKRRLINLLKDDGKGHKHGKFAKRLEAFIIHIVSRQDRPDFTAACDWENVTIYISDGFLIDPDTFYQLNVLMRHELAHFLLCHQIRMNKILADKYGEEAAERIRMSGSIHHLTNMIADFEISNITYTEEDKVIVRNMMLAGRLIGGLVTEDPGERKAWKDMSLEEMYVALNKDIDDIQSSILYHWDHLNDHQISMRQIGTAGDLVQARIKNSLYIYRETTEPTNFLHPLSQFVANKGLYHMFWLDEYDSDGNLARPCIIRWSSLSMEDGSESPFQKIAKAANDEFTEANGYLKQDLRDLVVTIAKTSPTSQAELQDKNGKKLEMLYTPEEKMFAIDCLKVRIPELEEYKTWYSKIQKVLADPKYSDQDLDNILAAIDE